MAYELHITRRNGWWEDDGTDISAAEWLEIVAGDPELELAGHKSGYFAYWLGHPDHNHAWLDWFGGEISGKHPDPPLIGKMLALADTLGARVRGDDWEIYTGSGPNDYLPPDEPPEDYVSPFDPTPAKGNTKPRDEPGFARTVLASLAIGVFGYFVARSLGPRFDPLVVGIGATITFLAASLVDRWRR